MSAVVAAARGWIGTPYVHGASMRGGGADCLGLIRGVWREVVGPEPVAVPAYTADWGEPQRDEALWRAAGTVLAAVPEGEPSRPGQVLLFRMRVGAVAKHLGLLTEAGAHPRLIHAYRGHGVVETSLSRPWSRRIVARFAFPTEG